MKGRSKLTTKWKNNIEKQEQRIMRCAARLRSTPPPQLMRFTWLFRHADMCQLLLPSANTAKHLMCQLLLPSANSQTAHVPATAAQCQHSQTAQVPATAPQCQHSQTAHVPATAAQCQQPNSPCASHCCPVPTQPNSPCGLFLIESMNRVSSSEKRAGPLIL